MKKYNIIYADPPWQYQVWSKKGSNRSAEHHYRTQTIEYLQQLNIPALCAKDCALLMWATCPCLPQAFILAGAWGFAYKTVAFTWVKRNRHNNNFFMGMGHYTRANAELVLLFTKGNALKRISRSIAQIVVAPRGRHSQKPAEVRERIVRLFGDLPRIELFARSNAGLFADEEFKGWDVFGDEAEGSIQLLS